MAGVPIAAANKATVMAFFMSFLRQFAPTTPDFIISPYLRGCTRATQTDDIAGWLTGSTLPRVAHVPPQGTELRTSGIYSSRPRVTCCGGLDREACIAARPAL
jgi:hypothetical protein